MNRKTIVVSLVALGLLAMGSAFGQSSGEKIKSKGVITSLTGDTLTVKTSDGLTL